MSKYIDADKLRAEIEKRNLSNYYTETEDYEEELYKIITSLQQEQPDYKEAVQLVFEEKLTPFKDGNQWGFLLGHNIQEGVCGFGDTILDAAVAFYKDYTNTRIHIGELKISMTQQEQPEGLHFTPLNRLIQKFPSKDWNDTVNNYAKKLRDCLITEGYRKDAEVLQGYISYMNGNNVPMATMDEQEQPEVDLEMVVRIDNIVMTMLSEGYNSGYKTRPFYEEVVRRINARKEGK